MLSDPRPGSTAGPSKLFRLPVPDTLGAGSFLSPKYPSPWMSTAEVSLATGSGGGDPATCAQGAQPPSTGLFDAEEGDTMHTAIMLIGALVPIGAASVFYIDDRRVTHHAEQDKATNDQD